MHKQITDIVAINKNFQMICFIHIIKNIKIISVLKLGLYPTDDLPFASTPATSFVFLAKSTITSFLLSLSIKPTIFDFILGRCASKVS